MQNAATLPASEIAHSGQSKIERYGWTVIDSPGRPAIINKTKLLFDREAYQREQKEAKVLELASAWSWIACGSIIVANRDGKYYVMDGQCRTLAACKRADIATLPCLVFEVSDIKDEARGFLATNTNRKPITSIDRFKAKITTDDAAALFVRDLLAQSTRTVGRGADSARCLTALTTLADRQREHLVTMWPVIDRLCAGRAINSHLLRAIVWAEAHMPEGMSLSDRRWADRLIAAGFDDLTDRMQKFAAARGKGGERIWAEGVIARLNHGLQNKLELDA